MYHFQKLLREIVDSQDFEDLVNIKKVSPECSSTGVRHSIEISLEDISPVVTKSMRLKKRRMSTNQNSIFQEFREIAAKTELIVH